MKALFEDKELEKELSDAGYQFSSANSINIGRLVPPGCLLRICLCKLLENEEIEKMAKKLMLQFQQETLEIFLLLIMQNRWEFRLQN